MAADVGPFVDQVTRAAPYKVVSSPPSVYSISVDYGASEKVHNTVLGDWWRKAGED